MLGTSYLGFWGALEWIFKIPVAARSKAWVCGRSLAATAGSNPAECMDVCLLCVLCIVRYRSPRRADPLSRGVLLSVMVKSRLRGGPGLLGLLPHWRKKKLEWILYIRQNSSICEQTYEIKIPFMTKLERDWTQARPPTIRPECVVFKFFIEKWKYQNMKGCDFVCFCIPAAKIGRSYRGRNTDWGCSRIGC
jgi:hypothetical protein